ncbi:hypothetical protein QKC54_gp0239 [Megavirus baoshan]|uniref:Chorein N-terminal domain-containing protein n=1 Tax=Megavirus baoshan TaxID=2496520 RepID=A0A3S8UYY5_9VIRU|nr:hypothetical protein QKC54_gp0239 [Megavirus baoshan]AZL89974.1 hypothetical protein Mb0833 [Megavirus baoshan]
MEWLKNICSIPIKLGLDKTNFVVMNLITYIFNIYGKKILKTDNDEIISHNECINDINTFYLHPLQFKEINYNWNENVFKINTGTITNLKVAFPWTSLFTQSTQVNIDSVFIDISMGDFNYNMIKSTYDDPDSYLDTNIKENSDINDVYNGIDDIVKKYFSNIKVNIDIIDIIIINHFTIKIKNCEYSNNKLTIEKIKIISNKNKSTKIQNISLSITNNIFDINISKIDISSDFVDNLPIIKFKSDKNTPESIFSVNIKVSEFLFSKLFIQNIDLNYCSEIITINNISKITLGDALLINFSENNTNTSNIAQFNITENSCKFGKNIQCKLTNINYVIKKITKLIKIINYLNNKIIIKNISNTSKYLLLHNIELIIIYHDDIWNLCIYDIILHDTITMNNIEYKHRNIIAHCDNIFIRDKQYHFNNLKTNNTEFIFKSKSLFVTIDKDFNINIDNSYCSGITSFGSYINNLIEQFKSKEESETNNSKIIKSTVNKFLNIKKAQISLDYLNSKYIFIIDNAKICLSDKSIIDINTHIFIDNYLISKINAKYISPNNVNITNIEFYLDPNIFDIFIQSFGLLIPNNDENNLTQYLPDDIMDKIQDALDNSIVSSSMYDLEQNTNKITESIMNTYIDTKIKNFDKPIITILSESINDFKSILIGDYKHQESNDNLKISFDSINIYLYDKLSIHKSKTKNLPFVCLVVKNISIIYQKKLEMLMTYKINIEKIALIDINCVDPKWKYFLKFTGSNAINIYLSKQNDIIKLNINLNPIFLNIREETLVRLLAYLTEIKMMPTNDNIIFIEKFTMNEINLTINYYPILLKKIDAGTNNLFIKDFKIIIPPYVLKNIDGLDKLVKEIQNNICQIINPNNIVQFVPNIKLVKPYVMPINNIIIMISKYIHSPINRNNLRKITYNINKNASTLSNLILEKFKKIFYSD